MCPGRGGRCAYTILRNKFVVARRAYHVRHINYWERRGRLALGCPLEPSRKNQGLVRGRISSDPPQGSKSDKHFACSNPHAADVTELPQLSRSHSSSQSQSHPMFALTFVLPPFTHPLSLTDCVPLGGCSVNSPTFLTEVGGRLPEGSDLRFRASGRRRPKC